MNEMDKKEEKKIIRQEFLTGERALFMGKNLDIYDTIFDDGESPLKESRGINLYGSMFKWKYPLWYSKNIVAENCHWFEMARAGVWYTDNIAVRRALIQAPKNFRRCKGLELTDVTFTHAEETLWSCDDVTINHVTAKGDYFAMNSNNMKIDDLKLDHRTEHIYHSPGTVKDRHVFCAHRSHIQHHPRSDIHICTEPRNQGCGHSDRHIPGDKCGMGYQISDIRQG